MNNEGYFIFGTVLSIPNHNLTEMFLDIATQTSFMESK